MKKLLLSFFILSLITPLCSFAAGNESVNPIPPIQPNSSSYFLQRTWDQQEIPAILSRLRVGGFVYSGGIHGIVSGMTSSAFATEAITTSGNRVTANSSGGTASIDYNALGCAANDTAWVIISGASANNLSNFTRSGSSNYFVDCTSTNTPALPPDSAWLLKATIIDGSIVAVEFRGKFHPFLGNVAIADLQSGNDLGAKINAADSILNTGSGEIWVSRQAGTDSSTAITITRGHTLRFIEGGIYTFTAGLTFEQGTSLEGTPGAVTSFSSSANNVVLAHNFNGDFLVWSGASTVIGQQGGGHIRDITLWNVYTGADLSGTAIKITGISTALRTNWMHLNRVFVDGSNATKRWTRGLDIDGSPVGGSNGVRDMFIENSRFSSSGTDREDIRVKNAFNIYFTNVVTDNSNNGGQIIGLTVTGTAGNISSVVHVSNCDIGDLTTDWTSNLIVFGGAYSHIITGGNMTGKSLIAPGRLENAPSISSFNNVAVLWYDQIQNAYRVEGQNIILTNNRGIQGYNASGSAINNIIRLNNANRVLVDQDGLGIILGANSDTTVSGTVIYTRGNTVASAATITLPVGNVVTITAGGVVNVDTIVSTGNNGREITIELASTVVLKNGTGNLKLNGADITGQASGQTTVKLLCDGTNWKEISHSNN